MKHWLDIGGFSPGKPFLFSGIEQEWNWLSFQEHSALFKQLKSCCSFASTKQH